MRAGKQVSIVSPVSDYQNDPRICLTSVHFPKKELVDRIQHKIIEPIQKLSSDIYFYKETSFHITIKNIRTIEDPPNFTLTDIEKAKEVFSKVIPRHKSFDIYYYKLVILPNSISLMFTTDPELDNIFQNLDRSLNEAGVPDNKKYMNDKYFFGNITLARFYNQPDEKMKTKIQDISKKLQFQPYKIDSVTLIKANASLEKCEKLGSWKLK